MNTIVALVKYSTIYVTVAIISTYVLINVIGYIAVLIVPCGGLECFVHSLITLVLSIILGSLILPTIACAVIYEFSHRNKR